MRLRQLTGLMQDQLIMPNTKTTVKQIAYFQRNSEQRGTLQKGYQDELLEVKENTATAVVSNRICFGRVQSGRFLCR